MSNLDDFFKKRDKKKKEKTASKFTKINPEEYAKQLETINKSNHVDNDAGELGDESSYVIVDSPVINEQLNSLSITTSNQSGKETTATSSSKQSGGGEQKDDEEWKPFESEDNKDYSGLKVAKLDRWRDDDEEEEEDENNTDQEKKPNCPWLRNPADKAAAVASQLENKLEEKSISETESKVDNNERANDTLDAKPEAEESTKTTVEPEPSDEAPKTTGAYVPPHLRKQQQQQQQQSQSGSSTTPASAGSASTTEGKYVPPQLRGLSQASAQPNYNTAKPLKSNRNQPNINDICEFPTLGNEALKEAQPENKFEQPKRVSKTDTSSTKGPSSIDIENRYNALSSTSS